MTSLRDYCGPIMNEVVNARSDRVTKVQPGVTMTKPKKSSKTATTRSRGRRPPTETATTPSTLATQVAKTLEWSHAKGLVTLIRGMRYMHETVWDELRQALEQHPKHILVCVERDGGHTYLRADEPQDYLPCDHTAIVLDAVTPSRLPRANDDPGSLRWAICSGCGRPLRYHDRGHTIMVLTKCPNLMHGTGVKLITEAIKVA